MANSFPAMQGIARDLSGNDGGEWGALWREFQDAGGRTGYRDLFRDAGERARAIESELKALDRTALSPARLGGYALDLLDGFNTTLENAVRVSAYKAGLDKGMSKAKAARLARELTVDFNRKGRTGAEISPLYAFFNASVQGTERTIRTLMGQTGAKVLMGGLGLGMTQALILAAAGYDDDELPEFVKTRNLVIPTGKNAEGEKEHILIPYPLGLHVLPNTGRIAMELVLNGGKSTGKRTWDAVSEMASAFNPVGGGNIFTADGALKTIAPTVIDPLIELTANKNFAGAPIERSFGETDNRPGFARAKESTQKNMSGQAYIGISKAFNTVTGGNDYEAGLISPSAERIRYLAQVAGGGVLREIEKTVDSTDKAVRGEDVKMTGIPILGRFKGETDDQRTQQTRFYNSGREIDRVESSIKAASNAGDGEAVKRLYEDNPKAKLIRAHAKLSRDLSALNKMAVTVVNDPEQMKRIDQARTEKMRALNEAVKSLEAGEKTLGEKLREAVE